ncbi:MAG: thioredoxin family protein [Pirellulales bacterium]|nr:thioredoxin family protein [Pirellulales bacterium]
MRKLVMFIICALAPTMAHAQQAEPGEATSAKCSVQATAACPLCETAAAQVVTDKACKSCGEYKKKVVMYSFSAPWCAPCKAMKETMADHDVAKCLKAACKVIAINIDEDQETAKKFEVSAIPTQIFVSADGKIIKKVTGLTDKDKLIATVKEVAKTNTQANAVATYTVTSPKFTIHKRIQGKKHSTQVKGQGDSRVVLTIAGKPLVIRARSIRLQDDGGQIRLECEGTKVDGGIAETRVISKPSDQPERGAASECEVALNGLMQLIDEHRPVKPSECQSVTSIASAVEKWPTAECPASDSCPAHDQCPFSPSKNLTAVVVRHPAHNLVRTWHSKSLPTTSSSNSKLIASPAFRPHTINPSEETPPTGAYCVVTTQGERHSYAGEFVRMTDDFIIVKENGTKHWIPRHNVECLSVTEERLAESPVHEISATRATVFPHPVELPYPGTPLPQATSIKQVNPQQHASPPLPLPAAQGVPVKKTFHIDMTLKDGEEVVSRPHLVTVEHQRACVEVGFQNGPCFFAGLEVQSMPKAPNAVALKLFNTQESKKPCGEAVCRQGETIAIPWSVGDEEFELFLNVSAHQGDRSCCEAAQAKQTDNPESSSYIVRVYQVDGGKRDEVPVLPGLAHLGLLNVCTVPMIDEYCNAIQACCPGTWADDGGHGKIVPFAEAKCIVVCQTPAGHAAIAKTIKDLQRKHESRYAEGIQTSFEFPLSPGDGK